VGLKKNATHQLLFYADDVNLLGDNIDTIKRNTQTLIDTSKGVGLEVNTKETKYMLLSRHQNARQNHDIKIANRCFKMWHSPDILERRRYLLGLQTRPLNISHSLLPTTPSELQSLCYKRFSH
jgi:hypothetical protein